MAATLLTLIYPGAVVLPLELTVCGLTIGYWDTEGKVSVAVWVTVFLILIIVINLFGALGYAEEEFWSAVIKLGATIVFMIIAFVCVLGGGPSNGRYSEYVGARLWYDPGAFNNGFVGFCSVFVTVCPPYPRSTSFREKLAAHCISHRLLSPLAGRSSLALLLPRLGIRPRRCPVPSSRSSGV